ncbi:hypothetical protein Tco_0605066, partial [Tanacetum coccineum]
LVSAGRTMVLHELLGADVNEDNFIERMTAIKERKKRALADLRNVPAGRSSSIPADYVSAGHVLVPADSD